MADTLASPHCAKGKAHVLDKRLNVRAEPSLDAPIAGVLEPGELVAIWALEDGWAIVQNVSGLTGWVAAEHLDMGTLIA